MPPRPKFTREEIVSAALELVRERGMGALTSRDLGARLGSSARPVFTVFRSMEEVQQAVREAAEARYRAFVERALHYTPAFKQFGMQMILFANEEPKLFQLLFMSESGRPRSVEEMFNGLGETAQICVDVIKADYGLNESDARKLFRHVWIHTYGIGALCATGMCRFTEDEISDMLGQDFMAMIALVKSGSGERFGALPVRRPEA